MSADAGNGHAVPAPAAEPPPLPEPGFAEVRIVASGPGTARQIADVLCLRFAADEQHGYSAADDGQGTRLHLTVDTVHVPEARGPHRLRLVTGHPDADEPGPRTA